MLWNNQFPETKILGFPASRRMGGLVYMASRDKVDVDTLHKGIQYALVRLGKSKFGFESTTVSNFKSKSHEGSGNELVDYSRGGRTVSFVFEQSGSPFPARGLTILVTRRPKLNAISNCATGDLDGYEPPF